MPNPHRGSTMNETEMSQFEKGINVLTQGIRQFHFVTTELLHLAGGFEGVDSMEIPDYSFATLPPPWAQDPFSDNDATKCASCHAWKSVLRHGKSTCTLCGDGAMILLARIILTRMQDEGNLIDLEDVTSLIKKG